MNFFKKVILAALVSGTFFMTSCDTQNDPGSCTPPAVESNIVGTWKVQFSSGTVEFKSDGTLVDPNDDIFGASVNNDVFTEKTYNVMNDTLNVTAASPTTSNSANASFPITKNECDKITLDLLGTSVELDRQ